MAEPFLSLDARERADILRTAAARHRRSPVILEKDIWVCWVLDALFSMPDAHPMAFKGGTSLSKVYGVIDRFSEDVDVTLDYRAFDDGFDPFADGASRTRIRQFGERLKARVAGHVRDAVAHALGDDGETLRFAYPSAVERRDAYVRNEVLLEFGGRNVIAPNERHAIVPDIAAMTEGLDWPAATVTVLSPARTFWEKATLVHVECHRRRLADRSERLSRHWFDLMRLAAHDIGRAALRDRALLADVVRHKKVFFHAGYARYDHCLDGRLRLVPDADQLPGLRADYDAMRAAGIVGADAPRRSNGSVSSKPTRTTPADPPRQSPEENPAVHGQQQAFAQFRIPRETHRASPRRRIVETVLAERGLLDRNIQTRSESGRL